MKAALSDDLYFKPLAFAYPRDTFAPRVEDQLMLGGEIMITPVYTQNAKGRYVYLPEEMRFVKFMPDGSIHQETLSPGQDMAPPGLVVSGPDPTAAVHSNVGGAGKQQKPLIEGFWNDMNEPAIFYTPEGLEAASRLMREYMEDETGAVSMCF